MANNTDTLAGLIPKQEMASLKWRTFKRYPGQGSDIVLHIKGYRIRENRYCHDFIRVPRFDGTTFHPAGYTPKIGNMVWDFSWLPASSLSLAQHDRFE